MLRNVMIGLASVAVIGIAFGPMDASAGGMDDRTFYKAPPHPPYPPLPPRPPYPPFRFFAPSAIGLGAPNAYGGYPYADDCYDYALVRTYYSGWRWRRIYVCG